MEVELEKRVIRTANTATATATATLPERYAAALLDMEKDMLALEEQLKNYLSFHNIRGWKFFR